MERRMGDSLLRWLGKDKPPQHRVRHKVWKKQLTSGQDEAAATGCRQSETED
jgi:hypothetical protein